MDAEQPRRHSRPVIAHQEEEAVRQLPANDGSDRRKAETAVTRIKELRKGVTLDGIGIENLIDGGRR